MQEKLEKPTHADVKIREVGLEHIAYKQLQLVLVRCSHHPLLQLSHHPRVDLARNHFLALVEHLDRHVTCAGANLEHRVGGPDVSLR
jgi:hypothetical protein